MEPQNSIMLGNYCCRLYCVKVTRLKRDAKHDGDTRASLLLLRYKSHEIEFQISGPVLIKLLAPKLLRNLGGCNLKDTDCRVM